MIRKPSAVLCSKWLSLYGVCFVFRDIGGGNPALYTAYKVVLMQLLLSILYYSVLSSWKE